MYFPNIIIIKNLIKLIGDIINYYHGFEKFILINSDRY